jgi:hypothetical protein
MTFVDFLAWRDLHGWGRKQDRSDIGKIGNACCSLAMPRTARVAPGGMAFHVLNRGIARMQVFEKTGDYEAFERTLCETLRQTPMRICAYCVLPNHWHFLPLASSYSIFMVKS